MEKYFMRKKKVFSASILLLIASKENKEVFLIPVFCHSSQNFWTILGN